MKPVAKLLTLTLALFALCARGLCEDMPIVSDMPIVMDEPLEQPQPTEAPEDENARVKHAQELLIELRYLASGADGLFGPNTALALRAFQRDAGLVADGTLNTVTLQALEAKAENRAAVKALQQRLIDLGYLTGTADGIYGDHTRKAVRLFQTMNGLASTGEIDDGTRAAVYDETASTLPEPLSQGDTGDEVERLQQRLIQFGFMSSDADGVYGKKTTAAVKRLQIHLSTQPAYADMDITATGKATPLTLMIFMDPGYTSYVSGLEAGASGVEVERAERRLNTLGYMDKAEDSQFDSYAVECARAFQKAAGLAEDVFDQAFIDALYSVDAPAAGRFVPHPIVEGDSGRAVREVEQALALAGMTIKLPTSTFDAKLITAVTRLHDYLNAREDPAAMMFLVPQRLTVEAQEWISQTLPTIAAQTDQTTGNAEDTRRVQRRLHLLYYISRLGIDGSFGDASAQALRRFQEANGLEATGEADEATRRVLFSEDAVEDKRPYRVEVDISSQHVYVFELRDDGSYEQTHTFVCSTGIRDSTPRGIFLDGFPCNRWHFFEKFNCWAQYSFDIEGDIMFHSVLYSADDESTLRAGSVNALGSRASHGCIRLQVADAKWLYEHCKKGSLVIVIY